jgi:hypothetical protein
MDWERITEQLSSIFQAPVHIDKMSTEMWDEQTVSRASIPQEDNVLRADNYTYFYLDTIGRQVQFLTMEKHELSEAETGLVKLLLEACRAQAKPKAGSPAAEEERKALLVREWFHHQVELGNTNTEIPEMLATQLTFYTTKIPLLLHGKYNEARDVQYRQLKKLLESFFEADIHLIPLMEKEWLILGPESLLTASTVEDKSEEDDESLEEGLASICSGLQDMLANEWVGECDLSIHYPMIPAKTLLTVVLQMRETMMLGRAFYPEASIYMPWKLLLERLLNGIPEAEKMRFLDQLFKRFDRLLDAEMQSTLDIFFTLDCNVSETAKKLFVHRNTLLYRLDKFKQETGFDVRHFNDAALVKIGMLLYKITKRK